MNARRVFVSKLLEPNEASRAQSILREIHNDVVFTQSLDESPELRISTPTEIGSHPSTTPFAITPLCLSQMYEKKIDPFDFEWKCNLINLFLLGKKVSTVSFDAETKKRLETMIEQMGGSVQESEKVDVLVSAKPIDDPGTAIVVMGCCIDALFGAKKFLNFDQFTFKREDPVYASQRAIPFTQPRRPQSRVNTSPRLTRTISKSQRTLGDCGISITGTRPRPSIKRSLSTRMQASQKLKTIPRRSNSRVDELFKASQSPQSSQIGSERSPVIVDDSDSSEEADVTGEAQPPTETSHEREKPKKVSFHETLDGFLSNSKPATRVPAQPELSQSEHRKGGLSLLDTSDLSTESEDEDLKAVMMIIKSPKSQKLDDLVTRVLASKPNQSQFTVEPPSDDRDAMVSEWACFSQKEEERPAAFDIEYEREVIPRDFAGSSGRDPLFDLFAK